jgi:DNA replication protein DnaC
MTDSTALETVPLALKALRLPTMARCWQDLASEAAREGWSHERFLGSLCDQELAERTSRRLAARLQASHLPPGKRLDSFNFQRAPSVSRAVVESLTGGDWLRPGGNVLVFGGTGSGKTHCAAGIGYGLIESGYNVLFVRTAELVQRMQLARKELSLPQMLTKLDRMDVIILDDIGYARKDPAESSVLFELIAERYERRSLIITSDRSFKDWDSIFPDKTMTVAAIDRLVHHSTILEFGAESYRLKEAAKRNSTSVSRHLLAIS